MRKGGNKAKVKFASLLLTGVLVASFGQPAFALEGSKKVRVDYNNIKISLDGKLVSPSDANGNYVEPFAINGTTYLPVRAVGNAMGLSVGWDPNTNTVILNSGGQSSSATGAIPSESNPRSETQMLSYNNIKINLDGQNVIPMNAANEPVEPFAINGTTYLPVRGIASVLGLLVNWDAGTQTVVLTTREYSASQAGASGVPGVPDGWLIYNTGNLVTLLKAALSGHVIYSNGYYWCSPEYAASIGNENVISIVDTSDGDAPQYGDILGPNTVVTPSTGENLSGWVSPKSLNKVVSKIGIDKILSGQSALAEVSELEILQYCMPSIPDSFTVSPVAGTYDGIRVRVENGKILINEDDLKAKGFM